MEPPPKKEMGSLPKRPDEWKDPWRRSKSPRRRPGLMGSPPRGRRRHRPSGSSVSLSNSSRLDTCHGTTETLVSFDNRNFACFAS